MYANFCAIHLQLPYHTPTSFVQFVAPPQTCEMGAIQQLCCGALKPKSSSSSSSNMSILYIRQLSSTVHRSCYSASQHPRQPPPSVPPACDPDRPRPHPRPAPAETVCSGRWPTSSQAAQATTRSTAARRSTSSSSTGTSSNRLSRTTFRSTGMVSSRRFWAHIPVFFLGGGGYVVDDGPLARIN